MTIDSSYVCQFCGRTVEITVDPSAGRTQEFVEDCEMCCRPNVLMITIDPDGSGATIDSRREND